MKRERIGRRDSSCSRCVAEAGGRMKIAFRWYTRARPVRSLVDLISYAELSSRSMQVAPLFFFSFSVSLSPSLFLSTPASLFRHFSLPLLRRVSAKRLILALKNRTFN